MRIHFLVITFFLTFFFVEITAQGDVQATRTLSGAIDEYFLQGEPIIVSITISGDPGSITVIEQPPVGWTITRVMNDGSRVDGKITWNLTEFTGEKTIKYFLKSPTNADRDGVFSGKVDEVEITGTKILLYPKPTPGEQVPINSELSYNYWLYVPEDYKTIEKEWPIIIWLHGGPLSEEMNVLRNGGPLQLVSNPSNREKFPQLFECVIVIPYCYSAVWSDRRLNETVTELTSKLSINTKRIYIFGGSMGGFGTWSFASAYPELIAAAVPICGAGVAATDAGYSIPAVNLEPLVSVPVWAFHGAKDSVVPEAWDAETVNNLRALGGNVKYTVFPDVGHDCVMHALTYPGLYQWLFQQSKSTQSAASFYEDLH